MLDRCRTSDPLHPAKSPSPTRRRIARCQCRRLKREGRCCRECGISFEQISPEECLIVVLIVPAGNQIDHLTPNERRDHPIFLAVYIIVEPTSTKDNDRYTRNGS